MVKAKAVDTEPSDSRQQLIEAGIRLFAMHGLDGASVRDIAQEAGTNICMISYHFDGKEGLYRACLEYFGRSRLQLTQGLLEPASSAAELKVRLKLFISAITEANARRPEFARIIAKEIEAGLPIASDIFEATFLKIMTDVIEFFRQAQKKGIVREDLDPLFIAHMLYGTVGHVTRCDTVGKKYFNSSIQDAKSRERLVDNLVETILSGVMVGEKKKL